MAVFVWLTGGNRGPEAQIWYDVTMCEQTNRNRQVIFRKELSLIEQLSGLKVLLDKYPCPKVEEE